MRQAFPPVDFDELVATCDLAHLSASAAELHGQAAGLHLMPPVMPVEQWITMIRADAELTQPLAEEDQQLLMNLYQHVALALEQTDLSFQLLLPDDDAPLSQRLDALAQWVQGFLMGLGSAGVKNNQIHGEVKETLSDLVEISQIESSQIEGAEAEGEDAEKDYAELTEYVRMAVLLLHASFVSGATAHG